MSSVVVFGCWWQRNVPRGSRFRAVDPDIEQFRINLRLVVKILKYGLIDVPQQFIRLEQEVAEQRDPFVEDRLDETHGRLAVAHRYVERLCRKSTFEYFSASSQS
jgi:hypothetical protein